MGGGQHNHISRCDPYFSLLTKEALLRSKKDIRLEEIQELWRLVADQIQMDYPDLLITFYPRTDWTGIQISAGVWVSVSEDSSSQDQAKSEQPTSEIRFIDKLWITVFFEGASQDLEGKNKKAEGALDHKKNQKIFRPVFRNKNLPTNLGDGQEKAWTFKADQEQSITLKPGQESFFYRTKKLVPEFCTGF